MSLKFMCHDNEEWCKSEILLGEGREFFLPVGENLRRSDFGDSNPFQS